MKAIYAIFASVLTLVSILGSVTVKADAWPAGQESITCHFRTEISKKDLSGARSEDLARTYPLESTQADFPMGNFQISVMATAGFVDGDVDFPSSLIVQAACPAATGKLMPLYLTNWSNQLPANRNNFGFTGDVRVDHCSDGSQLRFHCVVDKPAKK